MRTCANTRLAAVVILYHPTAETITNIASYYDFFDKVFIYDNTESGPELIEELESFSKIVYHHDHLNLGIAARLNAAAEEAIADGFNWLFTLDQDSYFSLETLSTYIEHFRSFQQQETVAMFGIEHEAYKLQTLDKNYFSETDHLITSGTIVNLVTYQQIGPFDEQLFIDLVDIEYSIRARKCGYRIIQFHDLLFNHQIGKMVNRSSIKSLFLVKKNKEIHSPIRCYYIYRNSLYMQAKHKDYDPALMLEYRHSAIDRIWRCLFYARDSWHILRLLWKARSDFKQKKMGKME